MRSSNAGKKYSANLPTNLIDNSIFKKIFKIERGFWESTGSESDIAYINEHFSSSGYIIAPDANGTWITIPKKDYVKASLRSREWSFFIYKNIDFKMLTDSTALIMYRINTFNGLNNSYCVMVCSTYQMDSTNKWKVISNIHFQQDSPGFSNEEFQNIIKRTNQ